MFIAHLAAGYLLTKAVVHKIPKDQSNHVKYFWMLGLLFSVVPDFDLFYFYLVDSRVHHHKLFPHLPIFWLPVFILVFTLAWALKHRAMYYAGIVCAANIFMHLLLDTFVGFVWWLYPVIDEPYYWILVPNQYRHWVMNFVFHWTFLVEILIVVSAFWMMRKKRAT